MKEQEESRMTQAFGTSNKMTKFAISDMKTAGKTRSLRGMGVRVEVVFKALRLDELMAK